jgi:hypothetical protein
MNGTGTNVTGFDIFDMPVLALVNKVGFLFYVTIIIGGLVLLFQCAYRWCLGGLEFM